MAKGMELAARAGEYVEKSRNLELLTPVSLGVVCFRVNPCDADLDEAALEELNRTARARVFWEDRAFFSSTLLHGTFSLRLCIINHNTTDLGRRAGNPGYRRAVRDGDPVTSGYARGGPSQSL